MQKKIQAYIGGFPALFYTSVIISLCLSITQLAKLKKTNITNVLS